MTPTAYLSSKINVFKDYNGLSFIATGSIKKVKPKTPVRRAREVSVEVPVKESTRREGTVANASLDAFRLSSALCQNAVESKLKHRLKFVSIAFSTDMDTADVAKVINKWNAMLRTRSAAPDLPPGHFVSVTGLNTEERGHQLKIHVHTIAYGNNAQLERLFWTAADESGVECKAFISSKPYQEKLTASRLSNYMRKNVDEFRPSRMTDKDEDSVAQWYATLSKHVKLYACGAPVRQMLVDNTVTKKIRLEEGMDVVARLALVMHRRTGIPIEYYKVHKNSCSNIAIFCNDGTKEMGVSALNSKSPVTYAMKIAMTLSTMGLYQPLPELLEYLGLPNHSPTIH